MASPDRDDRDRSQDVRRSHSPLKLEPLGAGGLWKAMVPMFCCLWDCVCACSPARGGERNIRPLVSGPSPSNLNKGFNTKKPRDSSFRRWFAGCLIRNSNDGIYVKFFT